MGYSCLIQMCHIGLRFLRFKCHPWMILAIAPAQIVLSSGIQRTYSQIRWMRAASTINFVDVYAFLNDLLW